MRRINKNIIRKKLIRGTMTAFLAALAVFFSDMSCLACSMETEQIEIESETVYTIENTDEINAMLAARGRSIRARRIDERGFALTGIVRLLQKDERWKDVIMQSEGLTIGDAGCALTSFTMVSNWLSNTNLTPADVNTRMGNYACGFNWAKASEIFGYTLTVSNRNDAGISDGADIILGAIDYYQKPVIVGMRTSGGAKHFVVAYGYTGSGDIIISDPANYNPARTLLSVYLNSGYYIYSVYMYSR